MAGAIGGWVRAAIASVGMCGIDAARLSRGCQSKLIAQRVLGSGAVQARRRLGAPSNFGVEYLLQALRRVFRRLA